MARYILILLRPYIHRSTHPLHFSIPDSWLLISHEVYSLFSRLSNPHIASGSNSAPFDNAQSFSVGSRPVALDCVIEHFSPVVAPIPLALLRSLSFGSRSKNRHAYQTSIALGPAVDWAGYLTTWSNPMQLLLFLPFRHRPKFDPSAFLHQRTSSFDDSVQP